MSSSRGDVVRLTRRQLGAVLGAVPLAAQVATPPVAEKTPPLGAPVPAAAPATPAERLKKAQDDVRQVSEKLSQMEVPMNREPAFSFRP